MSYGEQRADVTVPVSEIVPPHLAVIVRKPVRIRLRFREQQHARVFVGVTRHQHDLGRLKILFAIANVGDAGDAAVGIGDDASDLRVVEDGQMFGPHGIGNRGDRGRVLGAHVTSAEAAIAVKNALRAAAIGLRIDGRRRAERFPAELAGRVQHVVGESRPAQRRHGILALPGAFEYVAGRIDAALNVAGLPADAHFLLDDVVVRLQLIVGDRPIFERGTGGNRVGSVAPDRFRARPEIPGLQTPALRPVMNRRAADGVHHRMDTGRSSLLRGRCAHRGAFHLRFARGRHHPPDIVIDLIGVEILVRIHPRARFDAPRLSAPREPVEERPRRPRRQGRSPRRPRVSD